MGFSSFSNGYYRTEMSVQPYEDGPVIEHTLYDFIDREVYAQTDAPITLRVGMKKGPYFTVGSESAVPADVLAVPEKHFADMDVEPDRHDVFFLKPEHSYIVNQSAELESRFANERIG